MIQHFGSEFHISKGAKFVLVIASFIEVLFQYVKLESLSQIYAWLTSLPIRTCMGQTAEIQCWDGVESTPPHQIHHRLHLSKLLEGTLRERIYSVRSS